MGFLKGIFLEEIPEPATTENIETDTLIKEEIPVKLDGVNMNTLIEDIYTQNELLDKTKSIFKVEELINSLPKEMVTETKRGSVLTTLGVFGLTVTDVEGDGERRVEVLNRVLSKILTEENATIFEKEDEIENHKREIARLEKEITEMQDEMKSSETSINAEIGRITGLIKFIEGGVTNGT